MAGGEFHPLYSRSEENVKSYKDKRRDRRVNVATQVTIAVSPDGTFDEEEVVELKDLSRRGACLIRPGPLRRGQQFLLWLPTQTGRPSAPIQCRVTHCRAQSDGHFLIGSQFEGSSKAAASADSRFHDEIQRIRQSILG
jgi:hypothetical protein